MLNRHKRSFRVDISKPTFAVLSAKKKKHSANTVSNDFSDVMKPAGTDLQIDVCSGMGGGGGGAWHTWVYATWPRLRTKLYLWRACGGHGVQGLATLLACSQVWLQSVEENLLCDLHEVLGVIFVKKEGERATKRSIFERHDPKLVKKSLF